MSSKKSDQLRAATKLAQAAWKKLDEAIDETEDIDDDRELEELLDEAQDALENVLRGLRSKLR